MATIVVLGGGIGGLTQVYELRKALGKKHEILLISDSDRFEFTPSNPWLAVGWRVADQIVVDLPKLLRRHGIRFDGQGAKRLHPERFMRPTAGSGGSGLGIPLSEAILEGGEGVSIVPEGIVAEEGFGAEAMAKGGVNAMADFLGLGTPFVDNAIASNTLAELSARTQIALRADVPGGRPPVMVQELLARYAEDPAQLFRGDELGRINLRTTLESLKRSRDRAAQMLDSPTKKTPTRQGQLEEAYLGLSDTIADYERILESLDRSAAQATGGEVADEEGWATTPSGVRYRVK